MNQSSAANSANEFLGHPKGLYVLFFTEMWERFSYYGMRALLMLYLTKHFLFGDREASLIYGSYGSLVYAMPVLGGLIADRYLGHRKAVGFGAMLLVLGHLGMAFEGPAAEMISGEVSRSGLHTQAFYLSLAFIIVGVGFLKANISTIVGQLYAAEDPRRDAGFTIFYMGINIGAFTATLACAYLGEVYGWKYGFGLAGLGMLAGLLVFHIYREHLQGYGEPPVPEYLAESWFLGLSREKIIYITGIASVFLIWQIIQRSSELGMGLLGLGVIVVGWIIWFSLKKCDPIERDRMLVMLVLIIASVFFWALFEQAGSSLTLFTDRNVDRAGLTAGMFQAFNPFFIIVCAPLFAWAWIKLSSKGIEPSTPAKFGLGIIQVGLGFGVLVFGATTADEQGQIALIWIALMYFFHTTGELCLSPVGLSMVTKLSVQRITAMMMGVWFLSSAFAHYAAGLIASAAAIDSSGDSGGASFDAMQSLITYTTVFEKLFYVALVLGVFMLVISPFLHKRMHGIH